MRLSRILAAAIVLAAVGAIQQAGAFTLDSDSANNGDGTPRFSDPDEQGDAMANPSRSSNYSFSMGGRSSSYDPYGFGAESDNHPMPSGAMLGAGDHGFNNATRYGH